MDLDFLSGKITPPKKKGAPKKDPVPRVKVWDGALAEAKATIKQSIIQAERAIVGGKWASKDKPYKDAEGNVIAEGYFPAKNWTRTKKSNGDIEYAVSMTVGTTEKFKCLPKAVWKQGELTWDQENLVGSIVVPADQVVPTLKKFQKTLETLEKTSDDGLIFWKQAWKQKKPKVKAGAPNPWKYSKENDLWEKVG